MLDKITWYTKYASVYIYAQAQKDSEKVCAEVKFRARRCGLDRKRG